jgi:ABC-type Fe3+/spermidine/putrescine transport system ATPase subunit
MTLTETDENASERPTALEVDDLTKVYDDGTLAVDDISFSVREGEFCVLIGPSGCGKSTTLHSIVGKVEPTEGRIVMDGRDVTNVPIERRDIGLVFQDFQLFPHLDVEENIRYGLERTGMPESDIRTKLDEMVDLLRLGDIRERSPGDLSAGQQQRVALARSLVLEPTLLLLDEPLGDLDYTLQKFMEREFLRIHRELETTFVYVTHDQTQAMRLGDRVVVMNDGRIEQNGTVEEVYTAPATAFVATFVGDTNVFYGELTGVDGEHATVETEYGSFTASTDTLDTSPEALLGERVILAIRPQNLELADRAENTLQCTVGDVIHRPGRGTQILLEAGGAGSTTELQLVTYEQRDLDAGTVAVGWDPPDAILLERVSVAEDVDLRTDILGE